MCQAADIAHNVEALPKTNAELRLEVEDETETAIQQIEVGWTSGRTDRRTDGWTK